MLSTSETRRKELIDTARQVDEFICFDKWIQCIERGVSLLITLLSWRRLSGGDISVLGGGAGKGTKHRKLKSTDKLSASYKHKVNDHLEPGRDSKSLS